MSNTWPGREAALAIAIGTPVTVTIRRPEFDRRAGASHIYGLKSSQRIYLSPADCEHQMTKELKETLIQTLVAAALFAACVFVVVRSRSLEEALDL